VRADDAKRRAELADFLRTRRARLTPEHVGLPSGLHRRTPGLRREEVAALAGISETWYTWLERGSDVRPSARVLEKLAATLQLDDEELAHLFMLARREQASPHIDEVVSPEVQRMLDSLTLSPAFICGRRTNVLAWNEAADAIFEFSTASEDERIGIWRIFCNPAMRRMVEDWENQAKLLVSEFRANAARNPGDPSFTDLIDRLMKASPEFQQWWPLHEVRERPDGPRVWNHAHAGRLVVELTSFTVRDNPALKLLVHTPLPQSDTAAKIQACIERRPNELAVGAV
jgi:transcriptional regulator with XRE-family HTH domain